MSTPQRVADALRTQLAGLQAERDELQTNVVVAHCIDRILKDGDGGEKGMDTRIVDGVTFQPVPADLSGFTPWQRDGSVYVYLRPLHLSVADFS